MRILLGLLALSASALSGCSGAHPLPSDVVTLEVHQINDRIRCEARDTVMAVFNGEYASLGLYPKILKTNYEDYKDTAKEIEKADEYWNKLKEDEGEIEAKKQNITERKDVAELKANKAKLDLLEVNERIPRAKFAGALVQRAKILQQIDRRTRTEAIHFRKQTLYQQIDARNFNARSKRQEAEVARARKTLKEDKKFKELDIFLRHRLAYKLELTITQDTNSGSLFSFKFPVPLGTMTIDQINPSVDRQRYSQRTVQVGVSFGDLVDLKTCAHRADTGQLPYGSYPIVGEVGLKEVILQYLKLVNHADKVVLQGSGQTYTDTIRFTTVVGGGVTPKISITNVANQTFTGQISPELKRTDENRLVASLSLENGTASANGASSGRGGSGGDD